LGMRREAEQQLAQLQKLDHSLYRDLLAALRE
jgi:hypothetical protein